MSHFILEKAHRYDDPTTPPIPHNADYDNQSGFWRDRESGDVLISNDGFQNQSTKKCDRETGEDQKGE